MFKCIIRLLRLPIVNKVCTSSSRSCPALQRPPIASSTVYHPKHSTNSKDTFKTSLPICSQDQREPPSPHPSSHSFQAAHNLLQNPQKPPPYLTELSPTVSRGQVPFTSVIVGFFHSSFRLHKQISSVVITSFFELGFLVKAKSYLPPDHFERAAPDQSFTSLRKKSIMTTSLQCWHLFTGSLLPSGSSL